MLGEASAVNCHFVRSQPVEIISLKNRVPILLGSRARSRAANRKPRREGQRGFSFDVWERQFVASVLRRLGAKNSPEPFSTEGAPVAPRGACGLALLGAPVMPAPPPAPVVPLGHVTSISARSREPRGSPRGPRSDITRCPPDSPHLRLLPFQERRRRPGPRRRDSLDWSRKAAKVVLQNQLTAALERSRSWRQTSRSGTTRARVP